MMKKMAALLTALVMLLSLGACAEETLELPRVTESNSKLYENSYLGYSLRVWEYFTALTDEANQYYLEQFRANGDEDDDYIYDVRYWVLPVAENDYMLFDVQLKERTHDTFEEEVEAAKDYAAIANASLEKHGGKGYYENIHDGILRDTPAGQMLETAYTYTNGSGAKTTVVYYDFYYNTIEYCFVLEYGGTWISFGSMQQLLADMMATVQVQLVVSEV